MQKLSYKLKLNKKNDSYGYRKIKLRSMAVDPSYMREELAYDIANSIGLPTSKYSYTCVYINDQAIGLFGVAEVTSSPWVRNEFGNGSRKYNQGAIYVADPSESHDIYGADDAFSAGSKGDKNKTQGGGDLNKGVWALSGGSVQSTPSDFSYLETM